MNEEKNKILKRKKRRNEVKERGVLEPEEITIFHMYCKDLCAFRKCIKCETRHNCQEAFLSLLS